MLDLSATRQQASTTVNCAQKLSSCTICRDKLHCSDKIIPPAGPLPQLFWACRRCNALRHSHVSAATCPKICGQPARYSRQLEALHLDLRPHQHPQRLGQRGSAGGDLAAEWAHPKDAITSLAVDVSSQAKIPTQCICSAYLRHCLDTRFIFHQEVAHIELQKTDMKNKNIEAASGINIWPTCLSMARQAHYWLQIKRISEAINVFMLQVANKTKYLTIIKVNLLSNIW